MLRHTDCGITRLTGTPKLLGSYIGVAPGELESQHVNDPQASVAVDVAVLKANPHLGAFLVSGLVYSVTTGLVEVVMPPSLLRP